MTFERFTQQSNPYSSVWLDITNGKLTSPTSGVFSVSFCFSADNNKGSDAGSAIENNLFREKIALGTCANGPANYGGLQHTLRIKEINKGIHLSGKSKDVSMFRCDISPNIYLGCVTPIINTNSVFSRSRYSFI